MTLFGFPGLAARSPEFIREIQAIGERLSADPNWLLTIMQLESGIDPAPRNPSGKATGFIQFMPATAKAMGTTVDELRAMSDVEQLAYVERFYSHYAGKLRGPGDVYMVTFYPALAFKPTDTVIARKGEPVYDQNAGLDVDKNGILTVGDVESRANNAYAKYSALPTFQAPQGPAGGANGLALVGVALALAGGLWALQHSIAVRAIPGER
jgi:hypothetical protein